MSRRVEQVFSVCATRWKDRVAIEIGDRRVNYGELDERSNRLASRLIEAGVVYNDIVAIATGNIEYFAVSVLAILKAGAAYLAVDTRYLAERARDILTEATPRLLLADSDFPASFVPAAMPVLHYFAEEDGCASPVSPPPTVGNADDTACVFYTSGSSGKPKGIEVAHRGIPALVGDAAFLPFGPNDRVGQAANFAFDAINFELWGALLNGGCIVHVPKNDLFSAPALQAFLESKRITVIWLTTSLFNALTAGDPSIFRSLKVLVIGGEAADVRSIARVFDSGQPPDRLVNAYGPTEATTFATWHKVTPSDVELGRIPIGKPLKGMRLCLLDDHMVPVPAGEPGQLFIGGPGVAKGYLRQPALTDAAFVSGPWGAEPAQRLYRSGDLCRELPDGSLEYLGRADDQVKIRGFRVEPAEVVAILRKLPGIEDAVVLTRTTSFETRELIAFVRGQELPTAKSLRSAMAKLVPDYMLPSIIQPVDAFPLTGNGKLDRAALFEKLPSEAPRQPVDNRLSEIEKQVGTIWARILKRSDIERDDDFHEAGGDSLSLMNLALEIETTFGVSFDLDDFAPPVTVSRLAEQLLSDRIGKSGQPIGAQEPSSSPNVFAISYPWTMGRMPEKIGQALSNGRAWQHLQIPLNYFLTAEKITVEGIATHLERLIYARNPHGPYILFGHCFTGLLAYEVAQRLVAAGHVVSALVIVDSYPTILRSRSNRILRFAARMIVLDLNLRERLSNFRRRFPKGPANKFQEQIKRACQAAAARYRPRPYAGRVEFFRHENEIDLVNHDPDTWRKLVMGDFTEHVVHLHDRGRVTEEAVQRGFGEVAAKLKQIDLASH